MMITRIHHDSGDDDLSQLKMVDLIERLIVLERKLEGQMATRRQVEQVERSVTEVSQRLAQLEERQRGDGSLQGEVQGTTGRYGSISNMAGERAHRKHHYANKEKKCLQYVRTFLAPSH